jgi:Zn-dependent protease with chaperone function
VGVPEATFKLKGISPRALQHPADRAATAALHQVPYLDQVVKKLIELGYERALRQAYLGSSVRLGQEQLSHIWVLEREVFNVLDLPEVPDLYLTQMPFANAATVGAGQPIIVLNSELVRLLDTDGLRAVIAHEATHVLSEHVLYGTALQILLGLSARLPLLAGLPVRAVRAALLEWSRAAELTCDRGAAVVTRQPMAVCRSLLALAGGQAASELNLDAFIAQGLDYREGGRGLERLTRLLIDLNITHPMPVRRIHELLKWVQEGEYDRIVDGDFVRRGEEPPPREEAEAAGQHYADRVKDAFRSAGESVQDVGQQLGDWLSKQRSGGGESSGSGSGSGSGGPDSSDSD